MTPRTRARMNEVPCETPTARIPNQRKRKNTTAQMNA